MKDKTIFGKPLRFWINILVDIILIAFAVYYIQNQDIILTECLEKSKILYPNLGEFNASQFIVD